jgi:hypothetical protein
MLLARKCIRRQSYYRDQPRYLKTRTLRQVTTTNNNVAATLARRSGRYRGKVHHLGKSRPLFCLHGRRNLSLSPTWTRD